MNEFTRVYSSKRASVAHLLPSGVSPNSAKTVMCGRGPALTVGGWAWLGTGSQNEIDKANGLRTCKDCETAVNNDKEARVFIDRMLGSS